MNPRFEIGDLVVFDMSIDVSYCIVTAISIDPTDAISVRYTIEELWYGNYIHHNVWEQWLTPLEEFFENGKRKFN